MSDTIGRLRECLKAAGKRGAVAITTNELWHLVDALEAEQRTSESEPSLQTLADLAQNANDEAREWWIQHGMEYESEAAQVAAAKAFGVYLAGMYGVGGEGFDDTLLSQAAEAFVASRRAAKEAEEGAK